MDPGHWSRKPIPATISELMLITGLVICSLTAIVSLFKAVVIYDVAKDPLGGGMVPTLDFVLFHPPILAVGLHLVVKSAGLTPFPFFGFVLWVLLLLVYWLVMILIERAGESRRLDLTQAGSS